MLNRTHAERLPPRDPPNLTPTANKQTNKQRFSSCKSQRTAHQNCHCRVTNKYLPHVHLILPQLRSELNGCAGHLAWPAHCFLLQPCFLNLLLSSPLLPGSQKSSPEVLLSAFAISQSSSLRVSASFSLLGALMPTLASNPTNTKSSVEPMQTRAPGTETVGLSDMDTVCDQLQGNNSMAQESLIAPSSAVFTTKRCLSHASVSVLWQSQTSTTRKNKFPVGSNTRNTVPVVLQRAKDAGRQPFSTQKPGLTGWKPALGFKCFLKLFYARLYTRSV